LSKEETTVMGDQPPRGLRIVRALSSEAANIERPSVGARVREVRKARGWSLARLSTESGIPQSTLSKFETDSLSLPLDRIFRVGDALGIAVTEMFDAKSAAETRDAPGRRSISRAGEGRATSTASYDRRWLFADLIQKRMFPVMQAVLARDMADFGPLLRHEGEEFSIVLKGHVQFVSDIYEPVLLGEMDGIYIDSRMGHAYLNAGEGETVILNVSTVVHQLTPADGLLPNSDD
jgi:transcriptional regulator with XRE-family HTH domain